MRGTVTLKKNLIKMREEILQGIDTNIKTERSTPERDVGDFYDDVDIEKGRQLRHRLSERDRSKLAAIDDALEKIEDGTYGVCEECGEDIDKKRLKVMPFARNCIRCQSDLERRGVLQSETGDDKLLYRDVAMGDVDGREE